MQVDGICYVDCVNFDFAYFDCKVKVKHICFTNYYCFYSCLVAWHEAHGDTKCRAW